MKRLVLIVGACGWLALAGCGVPPPVAGLESSSYSNDHTTTAGGFGLGPEEYKTNGGAFGPSTVSR